MKRLIGSALLLAMLTASGVTAAEADDVNAAAPAIIASAVPTAVAATAPADDPQCVALVALSGERESFVRSFDWNQAKDPVQLQHEYAQAMKALDIRELELKRDLYQASGQLDLLARTQASLERLTHPQRHLPEIITDRREAVAAPAVDPEVTK